MLVLGWVTAWEYMVLQASFCRWAIVETPCKKRLSTFCPQMSAATSCETDVQVEVGPLSRILVLWAIVYWQSLYSLVHFYKRYKQIPVTTGFSLWRADDSPFISVGCPEYGLKVWTVRFCHEKPGIWLFKLSLGQDPVWLGLVRQPFMSAATSCWTHKFSSDHLS